MPYPRCAKKLKLDKIISILCFEGLLDVDGHLLSPCSYMGALQLVQDSG